jgi:hypothetical protein
MWQREEKKLALIHSFDTYWFKNLRSNGRKMRVNLTYLLPRVRARCKVCDFERILTKQ